MLKSGLIATVAILACAAAIPSVAAGSTITPDITADEDSVVTPMTATGCSLREAISAANTDGAYGGCTAASNDGPDTIMLANGAVYTRDLTGTDEDMNLNGDLDVRDDSAAQTEDLTIAGAGPDGATIKGATTSTGGRVLDLASAGSDPITVTISNVEISHGSAPGSGSGGGIRNFATLNLAGSFVYLNAVSTTGGGVENAGTANITNSTIDGNHAGDDGGGIHNFSGTTTLSNATVAFNEADSGGPAGGDGGGLFRQAGTLQIRNTISANNRNGPFPWTAPDCAGTITSLGYNFVADQTGCGWSPTTGDLPPALLTHLGVHGDNGGPTNTVPLLSGSPAIDAGNPAAPGSGGNACEATDQRGVGRPMGPRCDIGAFEATTAAAAQSSAPANGAGSLASTPRCKKKKKKRHAVVAKKKKKCKRKKRR